MIHSIKRKKKIRTANHHQSSSHIKCRGMPRIIEIHPGQMSIRIISRGTAWQKAIHSARTTQQVRPEANILPKGWELQGKAGKFHVKYIS